MSIRNENKAAEARERRDKEVAARHAREARRPGRTPYTAPSYFFSKSRPSTTARHEDRGELLFIRMLDEAESQPGKASRRKS